MSHESDSEVLASIRNRLEDLVDVLRQPKLSTIQTLIEVDTNVFLAPEAVNSCYLIRVSKSPGQFKIRLCHFDHEDGYTDTAEFISQEQAISFLQKYFNIPNVGMFSTPSPSQEN